MGGLFNQPSFAAGEISPELYGRVDQELYYIGLRTCLNFIVRQFGGAANRPGTEFIAPVLDHTKKVRLVPFQFNEVQTYILAIGEDYMRIIKDGAEVLEASVNITGASQASPCIVTAAAHGFSNGDDVYISGVYGMVELNNRNFRVANATANNFELQDYSGNNINSTGYEAYSSGGTVARVYTVTTPWQEGDLFDLNFTQSNDVLTVAHSDFYTRDITRTGHTSWTVAEFANAEGPFLEANVDDTITVYSNATTGSVTLTASSGIFDSSMVGELFYMEQEPNDATGRWEVGKAVVIGNIRRAGVNYYKAVNNGTTGTWRPDHLEGTATDGDGAVEWEYLHSGFGVVEITGYTSPTVVTGTVKKTLPDLVVGSGNASYIWAKAAWSEAEGYPAAVAYHKQRLVFGGTRNLPNGIWMSGAAARTFFGKSNPILDDDSLSLELDTQQVNAVRHLLNRTSLIALTSASEQSIASSDGVIAATNPPVASNQGNTGASKVPPIIIGNTALFVDDMGGEVRSLAYAFDSDSFTGIDLSARSPHLFEGKTVVDWAFQRRPFRVIWVVMDDGALYGFTYMDEQKVYAWHRHETDGLIESVATIREGKENSLYMVVKRTIGGETRRYIEKMSTRLFSDIKDAYFVDSGLSYDGRNTGATTMTLTGGSTWDSPETLTITASTATFIQSDIGDEIVFIYTDDDGNSRRLRLVIDGYLSPTVAYVIPQSTVPTTHRNAARTDWEIARDTFQPLWHIEGKAVAVLADGNVVEGLTVTNGKVTLPDPASVVHIGLPYTAQLETLDMAYDTAQGKLKARVTNIPTVYLSVKESRAVKVGVDGFNYLTLIKQRTAEMGYAEPIPAETTVFEVHPDTGWSRYGRITVQQDLPLPITITCITPEVELGEV